MPEKARQCGSFLRHGSSAGATRRRSVGAGSGAVPAAPALQIEVSRNVTRRCPILVIALSLPRLANPSGSVLTLAFQKLTKPVRQFTKEQHLSWPIADHAHWRPLTARTARAPKMKPIAPKAGTKDLLCGIGVASTDFLEPGHRDQEIGLRACVCAQHDNALSAQLKDGPQRVGGARQIRIRLVSIFVKAATGCATRCRPYRTRVVGGPLCCLGYIACPIG